MTRAKVCEICDNDLFETAPTFTWRGKIICEECHIFDLEEQKKPSSHWTSQQDYLTTSRPKYFVHLRHI